MRDSKPVTHCDGLAVHCMDYRLQKYLHPWLMSRFGPDNFDVISLPGGVHDYGTVVKYVQLAVQLHSINEVVLINHEDCRAYGRDGTYQRHVADLRDAKGKLEALFPHLTVETFYLHLDGTFELISGHR